MKRKIILVITVMIVVSGMASAQIIQGALIFGGNLSQVDGDEVYGFNKVGFNVGASAIVPFNDNWSFSIEALYSQKGAHRKAKFPNEEVDGSYDYWLNYAEVPVLIYYNDKDVMTFGAGFSFGRLVQWEEKDNRMNEFNWVEYESDPSINDFSVIGDVKFRVYKNLKMNFRYSYSLTAFREADFYWDYVDHPEHRSQYNNVISCRLIYVINEKQSRRKAKETQIYEDIE